MIRAVLVLIAILLSFLPTGVQAASGEEIIVKRTLNSKTYDVPSNQHATDYRLSPVHYRDASGDWQDIDNSWWPSAAPWDWEMSNDSYTTKVLLDFTAGQILEYESQGSTVAFQPMALQWTNDLDQLEQISMPQDVTPSLASTEINMLPNIDNQMQSLRWNNAYGAGRHFEWENTPGRLNKLLQIDSLLPAPAAYIINGGSPALSLELIFDPSNDLDILVNGTAWNERNTQQTIESIAFQSAGITLWTFEVAKYWDSGNIAYQETAETTVSRTGNSLYISIEVPYSWLQTATYPIFIDPAVDTYQPQALDGNQVCLSRWEWDTAGPGTDHWQAPYPTLAGIDLRTIPQMSNVGGTPEGYGLFIFSPETTVDKDNDYCFTDSLTNVLPMQVVNSISRMLTGSSGSIPRGTTVDVILSVFNDLSDPSGNAGPKPLRGSSEGGAKVFLNGTMVSAKVFRDTSPEWSNTLNVFQESYRKHKANNMPLEVLRRFTGATMAKLFDNMSDSLALQILPLEYSNDGWTEPTTVVTESFTGTNDPLGSDETWVERICDWDDDSNEALLNSSLDLCNAYISSTTMDTDAQYVEIVVTSYPSSEHWLGPASRVNIADGVSGRDWYEAFSYSNNNNMYLRKVVNDTETELTGSPSAVTISLPDTARIESDSSDQHSAIYNSSTIIGPTTDTAIQDELNVGLAGYYGSSTGPKGDDFEGGDITGAAQVFWGYVY